MITPKLTQAEWDLVRKALRNLGHTRVRDLHNRLIRFVWFGLEYDSYHGWITIGVDAGLTQTEIMRIQRVWRKKEKDFRRREGIWLNETEGRQRRKRERNQAERIKRQSQSVSAAKLASKDEEVAG